MINDEYKKKLSEAAKRNGLGGVVLIDVVCTKCNIKYKGVHNKRICDNCKTNGYDDTCKHCGVIYSRHGTGGVNCCNACKDTKPWLRKKQSQQTINKIKKSRNKWINSDAGIEWRVRVGKINSKKMKEFNKTTVGKANIKRNAKLMSILMREKISNGEFTPPITNTFTHWNAVICDKKFRSSWEACFWNSNKHLIYESKECRTQKQSNGRVYVGDFFDTERKILYEIKPKDFFIKQTPKIDALINHCNENSYIFKWINEFNIINYINAADFNTDDTMKQLNKLYDGIKKN